MAPSAKLQAVLGQLAADPARARALLAAEVARRSGSRSFAAFVRQAWHITDTDALVWNWHMDAVCTHLEEVARGGMRRLVINMPPRSGKSNLFAILWPAWVWTWWPKCRFLFLSHSASLATEHSVKCRQVIESSWYRDTYARPGGWQLSEVQSVKDDFLNTLGGRRQAMGITARPTGHGGDVIAIDDPLDANDAYSAAAREEANRAITQVVATRMNNPRTGCVVLVMQRICEDDPSDRLGPTSERLVLPSEFEVDRRSVTYRTAHVPANGAPAHEERAEFWRDPRTEEGELLFPERFPREVLEAARAALLDRYAGQHQQRPAPAGGGLFKTADWRFWKPDGAAPDHGAARPRGSYDGPANPLPARWDKVLISVDGTFGSKKETGSYVAIHVWGSSGARRCLLYRVHARMDYDECERALLGVIKGWPEAREKIVEDKANGPMLVNRLTNVLGIAGVLAESPGRDSKEQRASIYSLPYQRAGNVELPDGAPWLSEYMGEHDTFPRGRHDDDVDAQSQALKHLERETTTAAKWFQCRV